MKRWFYSADKNTLKINFQHYKELEDLEKMPLEFKKNVIFAQKILTKNWGGW